MVNEKLQQQKSNVFLQNNNWHCARKSGLSHIIECYINNITVWSNNANFLNVQQHSTSNTTSRWFISSSSQQNITPFIDYHVDTKKYTTPTIQQYNHYSTTTTTSIIPTATTTIWILRQPKLTDCKHTRSCQTQTTTTSK